MLILARHIAIEGMQLPLGKGVGFYKLNHQQKICHVRQSPEHFVKVRRRFPSVSSSGSVLLTDHVTSRAAFLQVATFALSATGMASPLVNALGPAASPVFWTK